MAELTDSLTELLDGQADQIGQRIGADPARTRSAIDAAVPALLAALSAEAEEPGLRTAIRQDHDGSILDQLSGYLDGTAQLSPRTTNGAGILEHTLGDRQSEMAQALSAKSGLDLGSIMKLLPLLAPILMGMLGKKSGGSSGGSGGGGGGFGLDDLGDILGREKESARQKNPDIGDILDSFAKPRRSGGSGGSKSGDGGLLDSIGDMLGGDRSR
ncbi:MAG TPA: DUF937 domain-containing protein [Candidatus Limnocylindrales bacterium]|nr:DUF937 domain-containing protein [Candidatus Limnocylindrales bacterium]